MAKIIKYHHKIETLRTHIEDAMHQIGILMHRTKELRDEIATSQGDLLEGGEAQKRQECVAMLESCSTHLESAWMAADHADDAAVNARNSVI